MLARVRLSCRAESASCLGFGVGFTSAAIGAAGSAAEVVAAPSTYPFLSFSAISLSCDALASASLANSLRLV